MVHFLPVSTYDAARDVQEDSTRDYGPLPIQPSMHPERRDHIYIYSTDRRRSNQLQPSLPQHPNPIHIPFPFSELLLPQAPFILRAIHRFQ